MFDPQKKFIDCVVEELMRIHSFTLKSATESVQDSFMMELMETDSDYVMHYSPYDWAKGILKEHQLLGGNYGSN